MLADSVEASVRSLSSHDEPTIRAMVSRIIDGAPRGRPVRRVRPDPARRRAGPGGVRRPAPRHVPPADRLPAEQDRRARGPARGGGRRRVRIVTARPGRLRARSTCRRSASTSTIRAGVPRAPPGGHPRRALRAALVAGGRARAGVGRPRSSPTTASWPASTRPTWARAARPTSSRSRSCRRRPIPPHPGGPTAAGREARSRGPDPGRRARAFLLPPGTRLHLGDIVVSVERAIEQADGRPRRPDRRRPLGAGRRAAPARRPRRRSTSAAGTMPSRSRRPRCGRWSGDPRRRRSDGVPAAAVPSPPEARSASDPGRSACPGGGIPRGARPARRQREGRRRAREPGRAVREDAPQHRLDGGRPARRPGGLGRPRADPRRERRRPGPLPRPGPRAREAADLHERLRGSPCAS